MIQPNLTYIQKLANGDKDFEQQLLAVIQKEFPTEKTLYFNLLKEKKYNELAELIHKIKHKFTILGLEKETILASNFEKDIKEQNFNLQEKFETILNTISDFLTTI
ncbi:histidine kinase [Tenacibaculum holothuriorum]|uniref:Histidine kinase n=1 Tax=Tenacibaculum holothuriorum TaxID=1635173 RepID=A0A1Y2PB18_9FLAO|nr:histidine kinase [Tenacibaculum holothuriorum]OSY87666.1 histidine kinase [Tenacibaculum holothuriorum]